MRGKLASFQNVIVKLCQTASTNKCSSRATLNITRCATSKAKLVGQTGLGECMLQFGWKRDSLLLLSFQSVVYS